MAGTEIISNSEKNDQFFEGVEKLIEIWFTPVKHADLRKITRQQWENVLKIVRCEIISFTQSEQVDAYVLSESSMFVSRRRWILKTCGKTTPLRCVRAVMQLAQETAGYDRVENVFYSRREFARPTEQLKPHDNFDSELRTEIVDVLKMQLQCCMPLASFNMLKRTEILQAQRLKIEVELLDSFFGDGRAYIMGPEGDCWFLYTLLPLEGTVAALEKEQVVVSSSEPDQTIEILMSELDPAIMDIFTRAASASAADATRASGIDKLIPGMVIDDYLFDPCGYSMNGVAKDGCYMTIHITPESSCSYVSFESNVSLPHDALLARVLAAFRPNKFVVTVFATPDSPAADVTRQLKQFSSVGGFEQKEAQHCRFSGYELQYALFVKFPS